MGIVRFEDLSPEEQAEHKKIFDEMEKRNADFFTSWGYGGASVIAAGLAYQEFLEKENREGSAVIYKFPMARRMFMIGWLRNLK